MVLLGQEHKETLVGWHISMNIPTTPVLSLLVKIKPKSDFPPAAHVHVSLFLLGYNSRTLAVPPPRPPSLFPSHLLLHLLVLLPRPLSCALCALAHHLSICLLVALQSAKLCFLPVLPPPAIRLL